VNKPITVRPGKAIAKPSVKAIEVDGVTLAAEPRDAKPKPKTKPKPKRDEVRVDGTVLSE
jgi:hypothetical protein